MGEGRSRTIQPSELWMESYNHGGALRAGYVDVPKLSAALEALHYKGRMVNLWREPDGFDWEDRQQDRRGPIGERILVLNNNCKFNKTPWVVWEFAGGYVHSSAEQALGQILTAYKNGYWIPMCERILAGR